MFPGRKRSFRRYLKINEYKGRSGTFSLPLYRGGGWRGCAGAKGFLPRSLSMSVPWSAFAWEGIFSCQSPTRCFRPSCNLFRNQNHWKVCVFTCQARCPPDSWGERSKERDSLAPAPPQPQDPMDGKWDDGSEQNCDSRRRGLTSCIQFTVVNGTRPLCQALGLIEQEAHNSCVHRLPTMVRETDGKPQRY